MQTESWILKQFCSFAMSNSIDVPSSLLLSSFLVTRSFSNGDFLIRKNFCWFPAFLGFRFLPYTLILYKQHFFFQLSLSVPKLFYEIFYEVLVGCCLIHISFKILTNILYLVYVSPLLDADLFMPYLCDLLSFSLSS